MERKIIGSDPTQIKNDIFVKIYGKLYTIIVNDNNTGILKIRFLNHFVVNKY